MAIVIKKRVSLDFLGEDYKDAYLVFQSIPAGDFDELLPQLKNPKEGDDNSSKLLLDLLKKYFIKGEFPDDDGKLSTVESDDLTGLDLTSLVKCFQLFTGQELDPKVETPLTSISATVDTPQEK